MLRRVFWHCKWHTALDSFLHTSQYMDVGRGASWDTEHRMEGDRTLPHKDYCTDNVDNSMCTVQCKNHKAVSNVFYIFREDISWDNSCHREGKVRHIRLCNGVNISVIVCIDVGKIHGSLSPDTRNTFQCSSDHMIALLYIQPGIALHR